MNPTYPYLHIYGLILRLSFIAMLQALLFLKLTRQRKQRLPNIKSTLYEATQLEQATYKRLRKM
jgi:hypothetical protein